MSVIEVIRYTGCLMQSSSSARLHSQKYGKFNIVLLWRINYMSQSHPGMWSNRLFKELLYHIASTRFALCLTCSKGGPGIKS